MSRFASLRQAQSRYPVRLARALLSQTLALAIVLAACAAPSSALTPNASPLAERPATPTAVPSPAPAPTALPTPAALRAPRTSPADAEALGQWAYDYDRHLSVTIGPRTSGTAQEREAADYIAGELRSLGYQVELFPFPLQDYSEGSLLLAQQKPEPATYAARPIFLSARGVVTAPLVKAGLGRATDFTPDAKGKVVLIERGEMSFQEKVANAATAGAVAVVLYNNAPGEFQGGMQSRSAIPAVAISREDGQRLLELLFVGEVVVTARVEVVEQPSQNVIGEKVGGERVIIVGGHYDTVAGAPGANDNASGTATVLALARYLAQRQPPVTLRFITFGSEEAGLVGSRAYVQALSDADKKRIIAVLNLDALGTGSPLEISGSTPFFELMQRLAERGGIALRRENRPIGGSDHLSFIQAGIPAVHIASRDLSRIHTPNDRLEFVEQGLLRDAAVLTLETIQELAARPFP